MCICIPGVYDAWATAPETSIFLGARGLCQHAPRGPGVQARLLVRKTNTTGSTLLVAWWQPTLSMTVHNVTAETDYFEIDGQAAAWIGEMQS